MTQTAAPAGERQEIRPGMIVNLRRRMWRVESIEGGTLTATPIDDFGSPAQRFLLDVEQPQPDALPNGTPTVLVADN